MAQQLFDLENDLAVSCNPGGRFHGWLFRKTKDGGWVSVCELKDIAPTLAKPKITPKFSIVKPDGTPAK